MNSKTSHPYLLVTPGEPAGIGPDLAILMAQKESKQALIFITDPQLLQQRAEILGLALHIEEISHTQNLDINIHFTGNQRILCLPISLNVPCVAGKLNKYNSPFVLQTLDLAIKLLTSNSSTFTCKGLVTGPIHKGIINDFLLDNNPKAELFTGHTEYLAYNSGGNNVIMMLATEGLRVALVTTHLALSDISKNITKVKVTEIISLLNSELRHKLGIDKPQIFVCGLNPHAGEDGHLGHEEIDEIIPAISECKSNGINAIGPLPADTIFTMPYIKRSDVILAMYHDQGLPVLKHMGFGHAVNITLGLPFIRTSVDHGTALDLAGNNEGINLGSLEYAIECAFNMQA